MSVHRPTIPFDNDPGRTAGMPGAGDEVATFAVRHHRHLGPDGEPCGPLPAFAQDVGVLIELYRAMLSTRLFDRRAIALQRTGQLGTYASSLGQEAVGAALGHAMRTEDVLLPAYREYAAQFQRGVTMAEILLYWGGDERGMDFQGPREDFPICVPIGTQTTQAAGVAYAFKYRREPRVAVCVIGDGATSKGDFYEAINIAGVWRLPLLFVVNNNRWAISVPRERQSAAQTLAQKAIAAGVPGEQVDGNDVVALRDRLGLALDRARAGEGPQLIEALTYRLCDHTTADDASRYRDASEVEAERALDPLARLCSYLIGIGEWDEARDDALAAECAGQVDAAVATYLDTPPQAPESMFDHLYVSLPEALAVQRRQAMDRVVDDD